MPADPGSPFGPCSPLGIAKFRIAAVALPILVTLAGRPEASVDVEPTETVVAAAAFALDRTASGKLVLELPTVNVNR
jgi:hypothetical protein